MRFPQFVPTHFLILAVQEPLAFLSALFLHQLLDPCCGFPWKGRLSGGASLLPICLRVPVAPECKAWDAWG